MLVPNGVRYREVPLYYLHVAVAITLTYVPPPVADMYSLEALKHLCMLQIPMLLTEDNAVDVLTSLSHSEGLGEYHYQG